MAGCIERLLQVLSTKNDWQRAVGVVDMGNTLIQRLAERLQLDEARILRHSLTFYLRGITESPAQFPGDAAKIENSTGEWEMFHVAVAERQVLSYISFWLGLVAQIRNFDSAALVSRFEHAVSSLDGCYKARAPRALLGLFEHIASGVDFERRTEGRRVSPGWWVNHLCARLLLSTLVQEVRGFLDEIQKELINPVASADETHAEVVSMKIFSCLELTNKMRTHLETVRHAATVLETLRHAQTDDEKWPDVSFPEEILRDIEEQLYQKLAVVAPLLKHERHNAGEPDLFGQAYKTLFDATFHAILYGRNEIAWKLFPIVIVMAEWARARLIGDLVSERQQQQVIFGTEPLVDVMELSGYALLMNEVNGEGIWPQVRALWDNLLARDQSSSTPQQFANILSAHENLFALTPGGIGRTDRQLELGRLLSRQATHPAQAASPIVAAFSPFLMGGMRHDLADLFIVEYILQRPGMSAIVISRKVEILRDYLTEYRPRPDNSGSEDLDSYDLDDDEPDEE